LNSKDNDFIAKLAVSNKDQGVRIYELRDGEKLNVGREKSNEIVIKDPRVSRIHASFFNRGNKVFITDLFSRNGTIVNGDIVVGDRELKDQDVVNLGASVIAIEMQTGAAKADNPDEVTATGGFSNTKIAAAMFRSNDPFSQSAMDRLKSEVLAKGGHNIFQEPCWALAWWHGNSLGRMATETVGSSIEILDILGPEIPSLSIFVFALSALLEEEDESWKMNLMGDPLKICEEFDGLLKGFPSAVMAERAIVNRVATDWKFELLANVRFKNSAAPLELYALADKSK
jgi:hypothetical protein